VSALPSRAFVVIRHGQTDANRDGVIAGRTEAQLTETGRAAARRLAQWRWPAMALFVSPQARARETAALAFPEAPARVIAGLRERDWGRLEGRPLCELPPREATPEAGEGWQAFCTRVGQALAAGLGAAPAGRLPVFVAHSGVIRATRRLTGGSHRGPSPPNTTPLLYAPTPAGWTETELNGETHPWIA
jgi:probable phosphoglycerate mutase